MIMGGFSNPRIIYLAAQEKLPHLLNRCILHKSEGFPVLPLHRVDHVLHVIVVSLHPRRIHSRPVGAECQRRDVVVVVLGPNDGVVRPVPRVEHRHPSPRLSVSFAIEDPIRDEQQRLSVNWREEDGYFVGRAHHHVLGAVRPERPFVQIDDHQPPRFLADEVQFLPVPGDSTTVPEVLLGRYLPHLLVVQPCDLPGGEGGLHSSPSGAVAGCAVRAIGALVVGDPQEVLPRPALVVEKAEGPVFLGFEGAVAGRVATEWAV
mmetsp:Transcript_16072/g.46269  ORF Transcript_16072/g.46269 Transcript_16072/m.46269 type:complete len:262 (-) Transcript_16072:46-831(-)